MGSESVNRRYLQLACDLPEWNIHNQKDRLSILPTEILIMILNECGFSNIDFINNIVFSLSAGLTCKRLYNLHRSIFGKSHLYTDYDAYVNFEPACPSWCVDKDSHTHVGLRNQQGLLPRWYTLKIE
ncbi:hypothetical protein HYFRA_00003962 [Hymenoscyphus fraxineus]|uniref:F-box domain-containing protein n=1 Tax=Hymenoscyphus fraxineus TaxID=746836 RepID=A0A9N9PVD4_9HELO|nr:hypothetical protein HYFRA_00003962 [Hymenoscyphus fraxineus]